MSNPRTKWWNIRNKYKMLRKNKDEAKARKDRIAKYEAEKASKK